MKERMTISIDKEIYDTLQELPRKVSLSEVVTWMLKAMFQDIKAGRELKSKELKEWIESTPEGKDFRESLIEHWGPGIEKIDNAIEKVKEAVKIVKKKKIKGGKKMQGNQRDIGHRKIILLPDKRLQGVTRII